ncbi:SDR family NAD(P)-dependent oxidoreductase [Lachnospiraceae bacterium ASD5720]|uniref:SDR family NAD(P)-dependent oxidoreductase n=1 Tax=Diplocloster agilis TaxID=2850323 RepID=A0A949K126_9FIRM|nr:SDR family NAD(P)-dependent oxidoreductase [Diplocloster agilis]MBU9736831.1 SDR family NAD(P)-dependent oxidoreductase [Diplocloster agilis]
MWSAFTEVFSLEGKHIAFTGAAGGIGRELALGLARAGASMALCDRNAEGLKELQAQIEEEGRIASCHCLNITEPEQVQKCAKEIAGIHGRIDVLVYHVNLGKSAEVGISAGADRYGQTGLSGGYCGGLHSAGVGCLRVHYRVRIPGGRRLHRRRAAMGI